MRKRSKHQIAADRMEFLLRKARCNATVVSVSSIGSVHVDAGLLPKSRKNAEPLRDAMIHAFAAWLGLTLTGLTYSDRPFSSRSAQPRPTAGRTRQARPRDPHAGLAASLAALGLSAMPKTEKELKAAWRAAAKRTHPDRGGSEAAFKAAKAAYERVAAAMGVTA
jgi:hypothetical protein